MSDLQNATVAFHHQSEIPNSLLKFAVIAARYNGKWIFCRHKERDTYEIPGGHREIGEDITDTAKRELYEETGALDFSLAPNCVYAVTRDDEPSYGMLFIAGVKILGELPQDMEMAEIIFCDNLPEKLTYPQIQPYLFDKIQGWLNLQTAKDEMLDIYDENRRLTGRTHRRADPMAKGDYHLVVHAWIQNTDGEFLITKRAANKGYANMWECTGGSAITGDDSITAAIREISEETGLSINPQSGKCVFSFKRDDGFCDVWLFKQDFNIKDVILQENETCDAKYASIP